jgi:hypothetical protein
VSVRCAPPSAIRSPVFYVLIDDYRPPVSKGTDRLKRLFHTRRGVWAQGSSELGAAGGCGAQRRVAVQ